MTKSSTYKVKTKVLVSDATASLFYRDTIKDVLEFADAGSATLNGEALADRVSIADQKITLTLTEDQVKNNGGKKLFWPFVTKIQNLSGYWKGKTVITTKRLINAFSSLTILTSIRLNIVPAASKSGKSTDWEEGQWGWVSKLRARDGRIFPTQSTQLGAKMLQASQSLRYDWESPRIQVKMLYKRNGRDGQPLDASHITIKGQKITVSWQKTAESLRAQRFMSASRLRSKRERTTGTTSKKMVRHGFTTPLGHNL